MCFMIRIYFNFCRFTALAYTTLDKLSSFLFLILLIPLERELIALQLCRWQFLYNETLQQTFRPLLSKLSERGQTSYSEEVRSSIEPWLMARWKARVDFLVGVIELLFLSLTAEVLQGKTCQTSLLSGEGGSLWAKISWGRSRLWQIFFGFYKTRHILLSDSSNCTVLRAVVLTQYRRVTDGHTDRQTDRRNCYS